MFSRLISSWAKKNKYFTVSSLMKVHFGCAFDSYGQNVDEIMQSYFDYTPGEPHTELKEEVSSLLKIEGITQALRNATGDYAAALKWVLGEAQSEDNYEAKPDE